MEYRLKWLWLRLILHGWFLFRSPARKLWDRQHPNIEAIPEARQLRTLEVKFYCVLWQLVVWGFLCGLAYLGSRPAFTGWPMICLMGSLLSSVGFAYVLAMHGRQLWWLHDTAEKEA